MLVAGLLGGKHPLQSVNQFSTAACLYLSVWCDDIEYWNHSEGSRERTISMVPFFILESHVGPSTNQQ